MADVAAASAHAFGIFDFPIFGLASESVSAHNRMIDGYEWQGLQNIFMTASRALEWTSRQADRLVCLCDAVYWAKQQLPNQKFDREKESQRKPDYAAHFGTCRPNMDTIMRASPLNR